MTLFRLAASAANPASMSQDDHEARHAKSDTSSMPAEKGLSLVAVLDTQTRQVVQRIEMSGAGHRTAVTPDGRFAVATHPAGDGISIIDLESLGFRGFVPTGLKPNNAVFAPDGALIYRVDLASGTVTDSCDINDELRGPGLSDREGVLFVAAKGTDRPISIDVVTGKRREATLSPDDHSGFGQTEGVESSRTQGLDRRSCQPDGLGRDRHSGWWVPDGRAALTHRTRERISP